MTLERLAARYNWQVRPGELIFLPGVVTGFNLACHMFSGSGSSVAVQSPIYPPILSAPGPTRLLRRDAPLVRGEEGRYQIGWNATEEALETHRQINWLKLPYDP